MKVIIVGAGIAGLAAAIALTKWISEAPSITLVELRSQPSTTGGAIGLTPNALRALHRLGVLQVIEKYGYGSSVDCIELFDSHTGGQLGRINFTTMTGEGLGDPPLKGHRIMRSDLLKALLEVVENLPNVDIQYGRKITAIHEDDQHVLLTFADGVPMQADLLIGSDGIHSKVRTLLIQPDRQPEYTGLAAASGFTELSSDQIHWKQTGLTQSQRGSFMSSLYTPDTDKHYVAAIMETEDVRSRDGWLAKGAEQDQIKQNVLGRYQSKAMPYLATLIEKSHDWNLYPVFKLGPRGTWSTKRAVLLGDAAHAMPPQGESAAIALEDAIVFGRIMSVSSSSTINGLHGRFMAYERIRRPRADEAYRQATFGWDTNKDCSWFQHKMRGWLTVVFLWWTAASRVKRYSEDLATADLDLI
ncbi:hypothetical protein DV736_g2519, partial [Chaetothyriales sp. CBS 134916]